LTVFGLDFRGHAAYAGSANSVLKIKEITAEISDNISFNTNGNQFSGAWDN